MLALVTVLTFAIVLVPAAMVESACVHILASMPVPAAVLTFAIVLASVGVFALLVDFACVWLIVATILYLSLLVAVLVL